MPGNSARRKRCCNFATSASSYQEGYAGPPAGYPTHQIGRGMKFCVIFDIVVHSVNAKTGRQEVFRRR